MDDYLVKDKRFRMALRKSIGTTQAGRRDVTDVLRTALWFADVSIRLNATTAYEVERKLEPDAFGKNEYGDYFHRNKWSKYEVGLHTPINSLVTGVETRLPGTEKFLNHVLWNALNTKQGIEGDASIWLRQLEPDIQKIVFQTHRYGVGNLYELPVPNRRQLKMLERRAGIDSLACLTILLRESCMRGEQSQAFEIGRSIHRVLLILCTTHPFGKFTLELFEIYRDRIYSMIKHKGWRLCFENYDFMSATHQLRIYLLALEDSYQIGIGWKDSVRAMCKILDGGYGFEIMLTLNIPIEANDA